MLLLVGNTIIEKCKKVIYAIRHWSCTALGLLHSRIPLIPKIRYGVRFDLIE